MPSTTPSVAAPDLGDTSGGPGRGRGRGGRGGISGRGRGGRGRGANHGRGGGPNDWITQSNAGSRGGGGRGQGRVGHPGGQVPMFDNIGFLPPPPGITHPASRWAALQPTSVANNRDQTEQPSTSTDSPVAANGDRGQRWRGRGGSGNRGRGHWANSRGSPPSRGHPTNSFFGPPPDEMRPRTWVEFRAQSRASGSGDNDDRPGTPGNYRGRGRGTWEHTRGTWERGRGGWERGRGGWDQRGRGDRGRGRGGRRGRARGGYNDNDGRWSSFNNARGASPALEELPAPRDIWEGVRMPALQELSPPEVTLADKPISVEEFKCVGSYTWLEGPQPKIAIPGLPRQWRGRPFPIQVRSDNGIRMLDENGFRMRSASALIPLLRAVDAFATASDEDVVPSPESDHDEETFQSIDWTAVDIVTDRNNLRKLARWLRTPSPASLAATAENDNNPEQEKDDPDKTDLSTLVDSTSEPASTAPAATTSPDTAWDTRPDFRIDLHLGGEKTVLMERWAVCTRDHVTPPKGGCRDNFVREATMDAPGCADGAGHYRIVQYNLDGLNMVVRWEVDTCMPDAIATFPTTNTSSDSGYVSLPDTAPTPAPVDIEELARWEDTNSGDAAAWGVSEPVSASAVSAWGDDQPERATQNTAQKPANSVDIDELAKWEDNTDQAAAWDTAPAATDSKTTTCPIEQNLETDATTAVDPYAIWDAPEDPAAAAAAWGVPPPSSEKSDASMWNATPTSAADWGVETSPDDTSLPAEDLKIVRAGTLLPQSAVVELATRSVQYLDRTNPEDTFLQLFLTQTPVHLVAVHTRGSFDRVIRQELDAPEFARFNEDAGVQQTLRQLVALLREIQEIVKEHGAAGKLSLVYDKGKLGLYSRVGEEDRLLASELARFAA